MIIKHQDDVNNNYIEQQDARMDVLETKVNRNPVQATTNQAKPFVAKEDADDSRRYKRQ